MHTCAKAAVGLLAGIIFVCAMPAQGQIVSVKDGGKNVYINDNPPPEAKGKARVSSRAVPVRASLAQPGQPKAARRHTREELEQMARDTAERHRIDPMLVTAMIEAESNWDPLAVSSKGAQGLMQLVPGTADFLGVTDVFDPEQNLDGGVRYLRMMLERYDGDLEKALAAYNAGPTAVDRKGGVPDYRETRAYVQKITDRYFRPGSGRSPNGLNRTRSIYRTVDERGRVVFTNE